MIATVVTSLGAALVAPIAVGIAVWRQRRRGSRLTMLGSWLWASGATTGVAVLAFGALFNMIPELEPEALKRAMSEAPRDTSDFERRILAMTPKAPAQVDSTTQKMVESTTFIQVVTTFMLALTGLFYGLFFGSIAWGATMLLAYAFTGRAFGRAPPEPSAHSA